MPADNAPPADSLGPNAWLVDEMFERYTEDPSSVSDSWQEFFSGYQSTGPAGSELAASDPTGAHSEGTAAAPTKAAGATGAKADPVAGNGASTREGKALESDAASPVLKKAGGAGPSTAADEGKDEPKAKGKAKDKDKAKEKNKDEGAEEPVGEPLRGAAARIVANMDASLGVPTATSFREVPAKLLEINRKVINGYLARTRGGKVSFTHLIGYAVVRAIADNVPALNASFVEDAEGKPRKVVHDHVSLGLAVDLEKSDGSRTLLVPVIRDADTLDFSGFWGAYEEIIRKVRTGKLGPDDFAGTTVTLTNPGTIGTVQSVPRLMPGQGAIIGVGRLDYPAAFQGADPAALADLGMSKVMTVSSTYDHRIIQGAESGMFLKRVHELLMGEDDFYGGIFRAIGVPYEAVLWRQDSNPVEKDDAFLQKQIHVQTLINMYRVRGHLIADLDPLAAKEPSMHSELDPATYGLTIWDLDREFLTDGLAGEERMALGDMLGVLRNAYCRRIGIEYMHIQEPTEKEWIQDQVEGASTSVPPEDQRHILGRLNAAEAFEKFLGTKYIGQKRFGIEGAESAIPVLDAILEQAAGDALSGAVMGMAHRGRLNVLSNIVGKSLDKLFTEFEGYVDPESTQGSGDVKYHLGQTGTFTSRHGHEIPIELAANPSHLEAVDPVVVGMARARQDIINDPEAFSVLPILVHGDAAFAGQGVVAETLNLSSIKGYRVGGTIHLIINNQLGFTTPPDSARSSEYCTDIAKMVQAPIFHVNGDDPEACVRVARLAYAYRQRFRKDVVIDMVCYRRHGHNEGDDPSYTQPLMYKRIDARRSVRKLYTEALVRRGDISIEEAEAALEDFSKQLSSALVDTRSHAPEGDVRAKPPAPARGVLPHVATGVSSEEIDRVYATLSTQPDGFTMHPKLAKQFTSRDKMFEGGEVDWALAEALAFGTLLLEGSNIRLSGQDSRRGTFSQRHSVLVDYETGAEHASLAHLDKDQGKIWIYDSLLSEYAALGFEWGYSTIADDTLVLWEAQFGDFVNGAQIILDQFLVAAEDKWGQTSGLVMLLPHGYEGQGPEHSSARIERFLTLAAEDNIQVANPTTAAQYFHLLRRQMVRQVRKPLVVMTPKALLRARFSQSPVEAFVDGSFEEVLDDPTTAANPGAVRRVVFCSGKVAGDAFEEREKRGDVGGGVAVVRVEQLYPWPNEAVAAVLGRYSGADEIVWLQEEPENMGPWNAVKGRLYEGHGQSHTIRRVSRVESGSPASGSHHVHDQEKAQLLEEALGGL